jgi:hypothetical protein
LGLIRIHWTHDAESTACGALNFRTNRYVTDSHRPLHIAYATNAAAFKAAAQGVIFANKTDVSCSVCKPCRNASEPFAVLAANAGI